MLLLHEIFGLDGWRGIVAEVLLLLLLVFHIGVLLLVGESSMSRRRQWSWRAAVVLVPVVGGVAFLLRHPRVLRLAWRSADW